MNMLLLYHSFGSDRNVMLCLSFYPAKVAQYS